MAMANETMNLTERDDSNFFIRFLKYFIPWKGDKGNEVVRKLVFMCSIVLFCMSVSELKKYLTADEKEKSHMQEIVSEYEPKFDEPESQASDDKKDDVAAASPDSEDRVREVQKWVTDKGLLERNSDVVGWLKIPGFVNSEGDEYINFPVLKGENNDYYLYKDLDKNYYESGSIFADAWSKIDEEGQSDNITIFGHHMGYVGTSFTHLSEYKKGADFLKEHPLIEFNSIYESGCKYAIVACFMTNIEAAQDDGNLFEYIGYRNFDDQEHKFDVWYDEIMKRSWYTSDVECTAEDKYITLSTCTKEVDEMRWVIVAKKLTADENIDLIAESYEEKDDKDIYFPKCWRNIFGNNKHDSGWEF